MEANFYEHVNKIKSFLSQKTQKLYVSSCASLKASDMYIYE